MDYMELVKAIRYCVSGEDECSCGKCPYCKTITCEIDLMEKAADAIEQLSMRLHGDEAAIAGMKREIERMVVTGASCWIPVTERLPESMHEYVLCCGEKGGQFVGWVVEGMLVNGKARAFPASGKGRYITHWQPLPEPPKEETE